MLWWSARSTGKLAFVKAPYHRKYSRRVNGVHNAPLFGALHNKNIKDTWKLFLLVENWHASDYSSLFTDRRKIEKPIFSTSSLWPTLITEKVDLILKIAKKQLKFGIRTTLDIWEIEKWKNEEILKNDKLVNFNYFRKLVKKR